MAPMSSLSSCSSGETIIELVNKQMCNIISRYDRVLKKIREMKMLRSDYLDWGQHQWGPFWGDIWAETWMGWGVRPAELRWARSPGNVALGCLQGCCGRYAHTPKLKSGVQADSLLKHWAAGSLPWDCFYCKMRVLIATSVLQESHDNWSVSG